MGNKAIVRGEIHWSSSDAKRLLDRDLDDFEILFIEGRSNKLDLEHNTIPFLTFLIGLLMAYTLHRLVSQIKELTPLLFDFNLKREAKEADLAICTNIDLPINEMYSKASKNSIKVYFYLLIVLVLGLTLLSIGVPAVDLFYGASISNHLITLPAWYPFAAVIIAPFAFFILMIYRSISYDRDLQMAKSINKDASKYEDPNVLVLVGDLHCNPVADELEKMGWDTKPEPSIYRPYIRIFWLALKIGVIIILGIILVGLFVIL